MPIILKNAVMHSFEYPDDNGATHSVTVHRGQDIEPLGLPPKMLAKLMAETVISWNGETQLPRYVYEAEVTDTASYSSGTVTTREQARQLNDQPTGPKKTYSADELAKIQQEAESAAELDAQRALDRQSAEHAEAEQRDRENAEASEAAGTPTDVVVDAPTDEVSAEELAGADRDRLKEVAADLDLKYRSNLSTEDLRKLVLEKTSH